MTELVEAGLYQLIQAPVISEQATLLADQNRQFVFRVSARATKVAIKEAIEKIFKVQVAAVTTLNVKGKNKRFKQVKGRRKNWKKAYVTLKEGFDIDFSDQK